MSLQFFAGHCISRSIIQSLKEEGYDVSCGSTQDKGTRIMLKTIR